MSFCIYIIPEMKISVPILYMRKLRAGEINEYVTDYQMAETNHGKLAPKPDFSIMLKSRFCACARTHIYS